MQHHPHQILSSTYFLSKTKVLGMKNASHDNYYIWILCHFGRSMRRLIKLLSTHLSWLVTQILFKTIYPKYIIEILLRYFTSLLVYSVFEIWCVVYTYSTSQFELVTFETLKSHKWLLATPVDGKELQLLKPKSYACSPHL